MNTYIDETTKEEFTEDTAIREAIDSIYDMLTDLSKEERLSFFKQISKPKELDFVKELDGIYYVVRSHFDNDKNENMINMVRRILSKEV